MNSSKKSEKSKCLSEDDIFMDDGDCENLNFEAKIVPVDIKFSTSQKKQLKSSKSKLNKKESDDEIKDPTILPHNRRSKKSDNFDRNRIDEKNMKNEIQQIIEKKELVKENEEVVEIKMSDEAKSKFSFRYIILNKFYETAKKFLFCRNIDRAFEIVALFSESGDLIKEIQTSKKNEEEKILQILEFLQKKKSQNQKLFKETKILDIFLSFLIVCGIEYQILLIFSSNHESFTKKYKFNFKEEQKPNEGADNYDLRIKKNKNLMKIPGIEKTDIKMLVKNISEELLHEQIQVRIKEYDQFAVPTIFKELTITEYLIKLNKQVFLGVYCFFKNFKKMEEVSISDVSMLELPESIWPKLRLDLKTAKIFSRIQTFCRQNSALSNDQKKLIEDKLHQRIPQSDFEFKLNEFYTLRSLLKRKEFILFDCLPTEHKYNDENVYLRKDVLVLKSAFDYRIEGRTIKQNEKPLKSIQNMFNREKIIDLYAEYQTEPLIYKVVDGKLPENQYGNLEIFVKLPDECVYLQEKGIWRACKALKVEYKDAIIGFDYKNARVVPVKKGIVILEKHKSKVLKKFQDIQEEIIKEENKKKYNLIKNQWKTVIKTMLVRVLMNKEKNANL